MPPRRKAAAASAAATAAAIKPASTKPASTKPASTKPASTKPASTKRKAPASRGKAKKDISDGDSDGGPAPKKAKIAPADDDQDDDVQPPPKMVTVVKRGAAPVDPASPFVNTHQVYEDGEVWDAMLNQTDLGKNANKFYVLQLLHPIGNKSICSLFLRWGRVGENGQQQTKGPWSPSIAINEFKKQFKAKSGASWEERKGMTAKKGKYTWLERSFEEEGNDEPSKISDGKDQEPVRVADSVLDPEVQDLCKMIFSTSLIDATLSSMNYDANKLPLGKLAKSTVLNGFAALKALAEVIDTPAKAQEYGGLANACAELSGRYYSIIPHAFGRNRPTVINNMILLKKELELVDALGDMEIAQKLISSTIHTDENGNALNPLDAHFRSLDLEFMNPVAVGCKEFSALEAYTKDTHGATHSHFKVKIRSAFRVQRKFEIDAFIQAGHDKLPDGDRLLLWHGSRSTNFAGILSQGLRIAPPEAPVNGYMFGKGVYFADMMSKSANYCHAYMSNNVGILLLCEVAAKPFHELLQSDYNAGEACKKNGKLTTKGVGQTQPVQWQDAGEALDNDALKGCYMPKGPAQNISPAGAYLQYNEYIVYDVSQIRVRYLLMVEMA